VNNDLNYERDYPNWSRNWKDRLSEVDDELIDYFNRAGETIGDALEGATERVKAWWDRQHLEPEARAEYTKAKADAKLWKEKIENRITHLVQDGKIRYARAARDAER
jgi:hypothetical protein